MTTSSCNDGMEKLHYDDGMEEGDKEDQQRQQNRRGVEGETAHTKGGGGRSLLDDEDDQYVKEGGNKRAEEDNDGEIGIMVLDDNEDEEYENEDTFGGGSGSITVEEGDLREIVVGARTATTATTASTATKTVGQQGSSISISISSSSSSSTNNDNNRNINLMVPGIGSGGCAMDVTDHQENTSTAFILRKTSTTAEPSPSKVPGVGGEAEAEAAQRKVNGGGGGVCGDVADLLLSPKAGGGDHGCGNNGAQNSKKESKLMMSWILSKNKKNKSNSASSEETKTTTRKSFADDDDCCDGNGNGNDNDNDNDNDVGGGDNTDALLCTTIATSSSHQRTLATASATAVSTLMNISNSNHNSTTLFPGNNHHHHHHHHHDNTSIGSDTGSLGSLRSSEDDPLLNTDVLSSEDIARRETKYVHCLRYAVITVLLLACFIVSIEVYCMTSKTEIRNFNDAFNDSSIKILKSVKDTLIQKLIAIDALSIDITSSVQHSNNNKWPTITIPDYEQRTVRTRLLSNADSIMIFPIITNTTRSIWEQYSVQRYRDWVVHNNDDNDDNDDNGSTSDKDTYYYKVPRTDSNLNTLHHEQQKDDGDAKVWLRRKEAVSSPSEEQRRRRQRQRQRQLNEDGVKNSNNNNNPRNNTRSISPKIFTNDGPIDDDDNGPFMPLWQTSPIFENIEDWINYDMYSGISTNFHTAIANLLEKQHAILGRVIMSSSTSSSSSSSSSSVHDDNDDDNDNDNDDDDNPWATLSPMHSKTHEPISPLFYPVVDSSISDSQDNDDVSVAAVLTVTMPWKDYLTNILPPSARGIHVVISNECHQSFTFMINGEKAIYIGNGDHHDQLFDTFKKSIDLVVLQTNDNHVPSSSILDHEYCKYTVHVYPSKLMKNIFVTNRPIVYTAVVVLIFLFATCIFATYDCLVERRQKIVMDRALQSTAIVSSLFPEAVLPRLYHRRGSGEDHPSCGNNNGNGNTGGNNNNNTSGNNNNSNEQNSNCGNSCRSDDGCNVDDYDTPASIAVMGNCSRRGSNGTGGRGSDTGASAGGSTINGMSTNGNGANNYGNTQPTSSGAGISSTAHAYSNSTINTVNGSTTTMGMTPITTINATTTHNTPVIMTTMNTVGVGAGVNGTGGLIAPAKYRLKSFLTDENSVDVRHAGCYQPNIGVGNCAAENKRPIADLFPHCTVMFADIAGFTAWSSLRDPAQVFTLLEAVYQTFDRIARKRGVFKVETVGDSYVAVTGLPDPQDDHAVIMSRFAKDCRSRMNDVTRRLELTLGPDTGDLRMRFGLHSGPVTAGVLRGEKSRFQLFGDTVNTAARMESTGERDRIQVSQSTADLLRRQNKGHWLTAREKMIYAKGKGELQTYWLHVSGGHSKRASMDSLSSVASPLHHHHNPHERPGPTTMLSQTQLTKCNPHRGEPLYENSDHEFRSSHHRHSSPAGRGSSLRGSRSGNSAGSGSAGSGGNGCNGSTNDGRSGGGGVSRRGSGHGAGGRGVGVSGGGHHQQRRGSTEPSDSHDDEIVDVGGTNGGGSGRKSYKSSHHHHQGEGSTSTDNTNSKKEWNHTNDSDDDDGMKRHTRGHRSLSKIWGVHSELLSKTNNGGISISSDSAHSTCETIAQRTKHQRLIDYIVDLLATHLKNIVARRRIINSTKRRSSFACISRIEYEKLRTTDVGGTSMVLDEISEVIKLPKFDPTAYKMHVDPESIELDARVMSQLKRYVTVIAAMYRANPFHNFEHACHVTMSVNKLLQRVVAPDNVLLQQQKQQDQQHQQQQQQQDQDQQQQQTQHRTHRQRRRSSIKIDPASAKVVLVEEEEGQEEEEEGEEDASSDSRTPPSQSAVKKQMAQDLHQYTHGITSDPLTQFAVVFSALIHDVDHWGVSNSQLIKEGVCIALKYQNKSIAEQNSVDLAWDLLLDSEEYSDLQQCIFPTDTEYKRFRQVVVNLVMATDIFDKELNELRKKRWFTAFGNNTKRLKKALSTSFAAIPLTFLESSVSTSAVEKHNCYYGDRSTMSDSNLNDDDDEHRKATIVIEHIMQASDVAHTMQHWHVYQKWNRRLFDEMFTAYRAGRMDNDPSTNWYENEIKFFDTYIIPLARKLKDCGVFGVASDECLNYAINNRYEWEQKGIRITKELVSNYIQREEEERRYTAEKKSQRNRFSRRRSLFTSGG